ncbi:MAG: HipA N-terminal domain-containing protein [Pseudomonadota bacterium]
MTALAVYLCDDFVGLLSSDKLQRFSFQYDPEWLARQNVPPLSLSLPLGEGVYSDDISPGIMVGIWSSSLAEVAGMILGANGSMAAIPDHRLSEMKAF